MQAINSPRQSGRFDFRAQFPKYKEVLYRPKFGKNLLGKPVIFDMDMSTGDFLTLLYLLKTPVEIIDLKVWCYFAFSFLKSITVAFVRSHIGWGRERSILYKGVETSP